MSASVITGLFQSLMKHSLQLLALSLLPCSMSYLPISSINLLQYGLTKTVVKEFIIFCCEMALHVLEFCVVFHIIIFDQTEAQSFLPFSSFVHVSINISIYQYTVFPQPPTQGLTHTSPHHICALFQRNLFHSNAFSAEPIFDKVSLPTLVSR